MTLTSTDVFRRPPIKAMYLFSTTPDIEGVLYFLAILSPSQSTGEHQGLVIFAASFDITILLEKLQPFIKLFPCKGNQPNFTWILAIWFSLKANSMTIKKCHFRTCVLTIHLTSTSTVRKLRERCQPIRDHVPHRTFVSRKLRPQLCHQNFARFAEIYGVE